MGPVQMSNQSVGFPDGNPAPALTVDFRQTFTLTPVSGVVRYALVSSPWGCLAVHQGSVTSAAPRYLTSTDLTYAWTAPATRNYSGGHQFQVLPFSEVVAASSAPAASPFGPYSVTKFRGIMNVADSYFTGSSMANGGVAKVFKVQGQSVDLNNINFNTVSVPVAEYTDLLTGIGSAAGNLTTPARSTLNLRAVSPKPEYVPVAENLSSVNIVPISLNSGSSVMTSGGLWSGLDPSVPVTVVEYSGLDSTASITIELRSCIEMVVQPGAMAGLAKPSPPADISMWQRVANLARAIPTARVIAAGATGYINGGALGALTAATQAMQIGT